MSMFDPNLGNPRDPVELAAIRAEEAGGDSFDMAADDDRVIRELDYVADQLGFIGMNYYVETNRALIIPGQHDPSQQVPYENIYRTGIEGQFVTLSRVHIGEFVNGHTVRALCLAFTSAVLLPSFIKIDDEKLVHVPVLAVESIEPAL